MNWRSFKLIAGITLLSSIHSAYSGTMGMNGTQDAWFISIDGGAQEPLKLDTVYINNGSGFISPYNRDVYSTNKRAHGMLGATFGYRWACEENDWFPAYSLGLRYERVFSGNNGETVSQYTPPPSLFTNYNYTLKNSANVVLVAGKLDIYQYNDLMPYISAGAGMAYNQVGKYSEIARPNAHVTPRLSPAFASDTQHDFAYTLGLGFDYQVNEQVIVSLGYEFQDLGNISSGYGTRLWSTQYLNLGSYRANSVLASLAYLFDC